MTKFDLNAFKHWPNFIVIGPGKAGTSWLYQVFNAHPEICISSAKETIFFDDAYARGFRWYSKFFQSCGCHHQPHAIGEVSNTYIFSPKVPQRIHSHFPNMKLISTLRNPIDRAFSHYLFERRNVGVTGSFEDAIVARPDLLSRGLYDQHLSPYFDTFAADQISVFIYDDLKADNVNFASRLCEFIGVRPLQDSDLLGKTVLGASEARNRLMARLGVSAARAIRAAGFPEVVTGIKNSFVSRMFFKAIDRKDYPVMQPDTRDRLRDYFRADIEKLSDRLQRDLVSLWLSPVRAS